MGNHFTQREQVKAAIDQLQGPMDKLKLVEEDYLKQKEALWVISEFAYDWEYWQDVDGTYKYVSPSCEELTGYKPKEFYTDKNLLKKIILENDWPKWKEHFLARNKNGAVEPIEFEISTKNGTKKWIHHVCRKVTSATGEDLGIRGSNRDITDIKKLQEKLQYIAGHDQLTGLPNRILFLEHLDHSIKQADRQKTLFVVAFIDIDGFKGINDQYGHEAGDLVLKRVSKDLSKATRKDDILSRFGGDEFVAIYTVKSFDDAHTLKEKILNKITTSIRCIIYDITIRLSIGTSVFPYDGTDKNVLLKKADEAMYIMKAKNKAQSNKKR